MFPIVAVVIAVEVLPLTGKQTVEVGLAIILAGNVACSMCSGRLSLTKANFDSMEKCFSKALVEQARRLPVENEAGRTHMAARLT